MTVKNIKFNLLRTDILIKQNIILNVYDCLSVMLSCIEIAYFQFAAVFGLVQSCVRKCSFRFWEPVQKRVGGWRKWLQAGEVHPGKIPVIYPGEPGKKTQYAILMAEPGKKAACRKLVIVHNIFYCFNSLPGKEGVCMQEKQCITPGYLCTLIHLKRPALFRRDDLYVRV